jgi:hypothetical protein
MNEILIVYHWIYSVLSGDTTITNVVGTRIYDSVSPNVIYPYIIYNWQGGTDVTEISAIRIMMNGLFQVKVVDKNTSFNTISPVATRIDQLLHRASTTTVNGIILCSKREFPLSLVEINNDIQYRHLGGIYRIYSQN